MEETPSINGDLSQRVVMHTSSVKWQASPSGTVLRKRVHLVGGAESGQVTSVVRYVEKSSFPAHEHPEGEEILVLDGVFSDEHGDWPAGSYLLNPEGFRHAPFSKPGCLIFVKLRQYAGVGRHHVAVCTYELSWKSGPRAGIEVKPLYSEAGFPDEMRLERWAPGATPGAVTHPGGAEILILKGRLQDESGTYDELSWLRLPDGAKHTPVSHDGCELYLKTGALPSLRSA